MCVCTVKDFSADDKGRGVKFCTVVHWRPAQGLSHYGELCSLRSPKADKAASGPRPHPAIYRNRVDIGSAYVDIRLSTKTDVLVIIKTCEAGLVLSVTCILRATLAIFRVYVCMYVCM